MTGFVKNLGSKLELVSKAAPSSSPGMSSSSSSSSLVVLHFWASWCEPCKAMDVVFAQLAADTPHAQFFEYNIIFKPCLSSSPSPSSSSSSSSSVVTTHTMVSRCVTLLLLLLLCAVECVDFALTQSDKYLRENVCEFVFCRSLSRVSLVGNQLRFSWCLSKHLL
jgi:hypothetical protein